jgi:hypothetical protein
MASSVTRFWFVARLKSIPRAATTSSGGLATTENVNRFKDRLEVVDRGRRKAIELAANRAGIETVQEIGSGREPTVTEAVASYLEDMKPPLRELKTYTAYKYCLTFRRANWNAALAGYASSRRCRNKARCRRDSRV